MSAVPEKRGIPRAWALVALGDLGQWSGGGTPLKSKEQYWDGGTIPWVSPKDMKTLVIRDSEDHITEEAVAGSTAKLIPANSVLFVTRSGILRHSFPVAVNTVPVTVNQDLKTLTPKEGVLPEYVAWALRAFSQDILNTCSKQGTTVNSIETNSLKAFRIPVATFEQQERIVAKIEKQFSRLDEAVANLKRVKANLKRYKAAVLKAAVEGKLTEEWRKAHPDVEPASKLLDRILAERRIKWEEAEVAKMEDKGKTPKNVEWKAKYKESVAFDANEMPELPEGWLWASLGNLGEVIGGLTKNPKRRSLPKKLPYLRVANVYANELRLDDIEEIGVRESELNKLLVEKGDLLIVEGNGSPDQIGRLAVWDGSISPCVHQNHLIKVRLVRGLVSEWILSWLTSVDGRAIIRSVSSSTSGLYTLSVGKVSALPVPLPPLAEQHRIVSEVDFHLSLIRETDSQVDTNLKRAERLRQSILESNFSGGLYAEKNVLGKNKHRKTAIKHR